MFFFLLKDFFDINKVIEIIYKNKVVGICVLFIFLVVN